MLPSIYLVFLFGADMAGAMTLQDWQTEIDNARAAIATVMKSGQASVSGGPGQGMHLQRANLRELREHLKYCLEEYDRLLNQAGAGVNRVIFGRMS
jgi:hypothetical protein